ncbi:relaxase/mobilization nuclease domain-containing protein (plasmid) [Helicobacter cinaedi]|uniref:relaxase/mobilization nuclease domain-containing protein n=1 Tax=Helicobacter cinaedi TaxID=213 RepID=UPI001F38F4F7|nr:relaxase/mobilization nuclease domain-containing protein [Helicobacter cinaedi]BDB65809.1 relaxase/mobilization nuclease domain-containing protein [Helicobacter cinaedi]
MIVKFFGNRKGGGVSSIDYLLNDRREKGTARILQGDEQTTRNLILSLTQKHKVCVGCLSFEEAQISETAKKEIMQSFENMLLTPAMQGRYNILWVEHTDKGRLELNFVIPKIDLESQKAFNPYFHMADCKRKDIWTDFVNLTYNLTDPKDPAKENTIQGSKKQIGLIRDYEALDKLLTAEVMKGNIKSRDNLIELLKAQNIEITRQGKDYISVKLPESQKAKRLKGGIYGEQFRSLNDIEGIYTATAERKREYHQRDDQELLTELRQKLESHIHTKNGFYTKLHDRPPKRNNQPNSSKDKNPSDELSKRNASNDDFKLDCVVSVDKTLSSLKGDNSKSEKWENLHRHEQEQDTQGKRQHLPTNSITQEQENDSIRSRVNSRSRAIAERARIHAEQRSRLIAKQRALIERTRERDTKNAEARNRLETLIRDTQREFQSRARTHRTALAELRERLSKAVADFADRIREALSIKRQKESNIDSLLSQVAQAQREQDKTTQTPQERIQEKQIEVVKQMQRQKPKSRGFSR